MVLHHVPQRARLLIKRPAALDAERFSSGNLHMVDVVAIPYRLKNPVGKTEDQYVLHRLLAQIVVDTEDLVLMEDSIHLVIQLARGFQIVAERLFDNHPYPAMLDRKSTR